MNSRSAVLVLFFSALLFMQSCSSDSPISMEMDLQAPVIAQKGQGIVIRTEIINKGETEDTLLSLEIGNSYLDGFTVLKTEPPYSDMSVLSVNNLTSFVFNLPVPAGGSQTVKIYARAEKAGNFTSEISFSLNSDIKYLGSSIRTSIR